MAVWARWQLHADALVASLRGVGEVADVVGDPVDALTILVATVDAPGLGAVVRSRAQQGRETLVWGGTLPAAHVAALREAGAAGYVSALAAPGELADAVRRLRDGQAPAWPPEPVQVVRLTPRERQAAGAYLVSQADRTRAEVALGLGMSERTLKVHISRIRDKTGHEGTATREGLLHELVRLGWL